MTGNNKHNDGYTLVEVLVALGIFVLISALATGAFLSILSAQRNTLAQQNASQELRFFQDSISRDIRAAKSVTCPAAPAASSSVVITRSADGLDQVSYTLDQDTHKIMQIIGTAPAVPITDINVSGFTVFCHDLGASKTVVTLTMSVEGVALPYQVSIMPRIGIIQ